MENTRSNAQPRIGSKLRARRKQQNLTLGELAKLTDLSSGFLSQLENDKASPSLSSLVNICQALGADVRDFLFVPAADSIATYASHRLQYRVPQNDVLYERTTGSFDGRVLNGLMMTIPAGYACELQTHDGEEMYVVLEGAIFCEVNGESFELHVGDTIHFGSNSAHRYGNPTNQPAKVMWVGTLELFGER